MDNIDWGKFGFTFFIISYITICLGAIFISVWMSIGWERTLLFSGIVIAIAFIIGVASYFVAREPKRFRA